MEWYEIAGAISGILSLPVLIGALWALARGSYSKAKVEQLRADIDDLITRNQQKDAELVEERAHVAALELKSQHQQIEIDDLRELVTQRAEVQEVKVAVVSVLDELRDHHVEALSALNKHNQEVRQFWANTSTSLTALLRRTEGGA